MNELLNAGFTLTFRKTKDNKFIGGYLRKIEEGMYPKELCGDEVIYISNYSNILERVNNGNILQIYKSLDGYCSMIGNIHYEGPYAEKEYFDVISFGNSDTLIGSLNDLNNKLDNEKELVHKKIYHMYGSDKYKLNR